MFMIILYNVKRRSFAVLLHSAAASAPKKYISEILFRQRIVSGQKQKCEICRFPLYKCHPPGSGQGNLWHKADTPINFIFRALMGIRSRHGSDRLNCLSGQKI
jgi:hypothetical protein